MTVDLKAAGVVVGVVGALGAAAGSWYVNSYRLDKLEQEVIQMRAEREQGEEEVLDKIDEVKCLVAEVHALPLPECK